jgi:transcriptional regulator with XRE-family HTH domain
MPLKIAKMQGLLGRKNTVKRYTLIVKQTQKGMINMTFGEKLQQLRKQNGLSQEQLAEKLNVSRQAISKWEMGTIPDMENVVKLGRFFDCSLDYLMNNEIDEMDNNSQKNEPVTKTEVSNKNIVFKLTSVVCIVIGAILSLLMPLFAKLYQAFEFENSGSCFTNSSDYIFQFPMLGIMLIALMLIIIGGSIYYFKVRTK